MRLVVTNLVAWVDVNVDVMMSGLVPFLLCPLLQGPCVGPLRPEAIFLRQTPSTWRTGTNYMGHIMYLIFFVKPQNGLFDFVVSVFI